MCMRKAADGLTRADQVEGLAADLAHANTAVGRMVPQETAVLLTAPSMSNIIDDNDNKISCVLHQADTQYTAEALANAPAGGR